MKIVTFTITHIFGDMDRDPPESALRALIGELADADDEHPDVAVSDESGWTLGAYGGGRVVWENVEENDEPRHLEGIDDERLLVLFQTLARGDVAAIEALPWMPGY